MNDDTSDDGRVEVLEEELEKLRRTQALGLVPASLLQDLNTLLTPMFGLAALLERQCEPCNGAAPMAREMREITEKAGLLVRDILSLGRRRASAAAPVNVSRAIAELRPLIERFLGENVLLALSLHEPGSEVMLERERLEHAILNLVANARDAMPRGGVVTITTDEVVLESEEVFVRLIVSDTGIGMTEEVRARVFDPFFT